MPWDNFHQKKYNQGNPCAKAVLWNKTMGSLTKWKPPREEDEVLDQLDKGLKEIFLEKDPPPKKKTPTPCLDLHGCYLYASYGRVKRFLEQSQLEGCRRVLIITGKGLHSQEGPVLKEEIPKYLERECLGIVKSFSWVLGKDGSSGTLACHLYPLETFL